MFERFKKITVLELDPFEKNKQNIFPRTNNITTRCTLANVTNQTRV